MDNLEEMDKFVETFNLSRLNQEEIENMNRTIASSEIETVTKKFPTNKNLGPDDFTYKFYQISREKLGHSSETPSQNCRGRNNLKLIL